MACLDEQTPLGRWVAERPARARTLGHLGIDYCCDVQVPLGQACAWAGLDVRDVLRLLDLPDAAEDQETHLGRTWPTLNALIDHILDEHHGFLRRKVPGLIELANRVATAHGARYPELLGVAHELGEFWAELEPHLRREEEEVFPSLRRLAATWDPVVDGVAAAGELIEPVEHDHLGTAASLGRLRALTDRYTAPESACTLHRALVAGLAALEADMRLHIHEENNLLFPWTRAQRRPDTPGSRAVAS